MMSSFTQKKISTVRGNGINIFLLIDHFCTLQRFVNHIKKKLPKATIFTSLDFDYYSDDPPPVPVHFLFFCDQFPKFYGDITIENLIQHCPDAKRILVGLELEFFEHKKSKNFNDQFQPCAVISPFIKSIDLGLLLLNLMDPQWIDPQKG